MKELRIDVLSGYHHASQGLGLLEDATGSVSATTGEPDDLVVFGQPATLTRAQVLLILRLWRTAYLVSIVRLRPPGLVARDAYRTLY